MTETRPLFTIGYEKATPDRLFAELAASGVSLVVDVRALAVSRRPGFAKTALAAGLAEWGIAYLHRKALGTPKEGRLAAAAGDRDRFEAIVARQLATPEAGLALAELADLAQSRAVCLLCLEDDPAQCHRTQVAAALRDLAPFAVVDLRVRPG